MDDKTTTTTNNSTSISAAAAAIVAATLAATCSNNNGSLSLSNIATSNSNPQLCVNDLLHPTAKAESLLEALTTEQLNVIEQTLNKIREKKHLSEGNALDGVCYCVYV